MGQGLVIAWTDVGRRAAVVAGMIVAVVSLAQHCPLWVASIRGGAAIVVVALIVHAIAYLLASSSARDRELARARIVAAADAASAKAVGKNGNPRG